LAAASAAAEGPCDIYDAAPEGTPCVAAHSTVRALYGSYIGPLYTVKRLSDGATKEIAPVAAGGYADAAAQDAFCGTGACTIWQIFDQTKHQNHMTIAPAGGAHREEDRPCNATRAKLTIGGHPVYAAFFEGGMGYRVDETSGVAIHDQAETMYMVTSGTHFNDRCCFDYGNAETNNLDDGAGTMEAVYFGSAKGGLNHGGAGAGPWIMADMENALWGADVIVSNEEPINHTFVTAMVKGDVSVSKVPPKPGPYQPGVDYGGSDIAPCGFNGCTLPASSTHLDCEAKCNTTMGCVGYVYADASCSGNKGGAICWTKGAMRKGAPRSCRNSRVLVPDGSVPGHWAIKGGDATQGALKVYWDGKRAPGYAPMKKQGAIILGIGGDNSDGAVGTFYEGVMTAGYTSDETDDKVQANIVAAGYGK
jgi:hypothetical protein